MDNLEKQTKEVNLGSPPQSPEKISVSPNQGQQAQSQDDNQQQGISNIKEKISKIPSDDKKPQSDSPVQPVSLEIKNFDDLLDIKGSDLRFKSLLQFAGNDRGKQDEALEWAKEIWEETAEAYLLDILRDELAKII